ncbi:hypothetical protein [Mycobacterium shimoidei]|uniref:hypothetical protein n=1 Tax=Mycobacterium shimoidei TaxID=29313 RepID=UPI000848F5B5|nr:hypothetical protein [Mycobacterium shimoidei]MCV7261121.1 hypothetical protein [Mycobacterium shimoidei]ODR07205.1 hypothetical protein BHQ16_21400 [Mycobacterium shimoidei]ORW77397.1 hypothetical protein AWC26_19790 [Mycobacterium shimoidei]
MKTLLKFILNNVEFLYLNPAYRFTDSKNRGLSEIDASISLTSDVLRWNIINDRGQIYFTVVPLSSAKNSFWLSLVRQYLEGGNEIQVVAPVDEANWLSSNLPRVERLFSDESQIARICDELVALREANARKRSASYRRLTTES